MKKPGRPRVVNAVAENWPIGKLDRLPDMKGVYVLYDKYHLPLTAGEAGRGKQTIRDRIYGKSHRPYKGKKVRFFSAFDVNKGIQHQIETLLHHAFGGVLPHDKNYGKWLKTTRTYPSEDYE